MNTTSTRYPVIVATPNDAIKYSQARNKEEQLHHIKKKKTFEKVKKIFGKIVKKKKNDKIKVDEQYCFSIMDDDTKTDSGYNATESLNEDSFSEYTTSNYFSRFEPPSPSITTNQEIVQYNPNMNKKHSRLNFVKKLKEKRVAKKAKKRYRENLQNATLSFNNSDLTVQNSVTSPRLYETPNYNYMTESPMLKYKNSGLTYLNSNEDLNKVKDYASSIYSDDSFNLPDDEENTTDKSEDEKERPSSMEVEINGKEKNNGREKKFNNPRYKGHFEDSDEEEKSKPKQPALPMQRPLAYMKKNWDNPFGRISFIEYTIEKQKEKEKEMNKKNQNINKFNIVTKPPLKNNITKNGQMIVSKRSISSLSASLNKSRQEEVHNAAIRARENSLKKLANQNTNKVDNNNATTTTATTITTTTTTTAINNNKDTDDNHITNNNENKKETDSNDSIVIPPRPKNNLKDDGPKRNSMNNDDKRASVYSVTNLIKYSDFYDHPNDTSYSTIQPDDHYNQVINQYNKYKNKEPSKDDDQNNYDSDVMDKEEDNAYNTNIINFNISDELDVEGKDIKLSVKKSSNGINNKSDHRKAIITELANDTLENNENNETEEAAPANDIEYNPYLPSIPSAKYLLNNPRLVRNRVINIDDNNFNVLKHVNTLKANRKSIIEAELRAKKEIESEKRKEKIKKEEEKLKETQDDDNTEQIEKKETEKDEEDNSAEEINSPRYPEDHYREYYEKEAVKPPEEKGIDDALAESKDKAKGKSISEIVTKVFSKNNEEAKNPEDEKSTTLVTSPNDETSSVKSKSTQKPEENKEENKKEDNINNNTTISTRLFNLLKVPTKYLYNEEKEDNNENEKTTTGKEKGKEKEGNEVKNKENKEKEDVISNHVLSPKGSPIKPYIQAINGSTKLVRSASLSHAKRHKQQINESKFRNMKNLDRNNSTRTVESAINIGTSQENENINVMRSKSTMDKAYSNTATFDDEDDNENSDADRTIILEKKTNVEPDKALTINSKSKEEDKDEKPIFSENYLYNEPELELNEFNIKDENIASKIHNLQNDIILEEEEEKEDILVKIQAEMNKRFQKEYDDDKDKNSKEIAETFSIASCSTFSSAI
ncbi:hypothetical protein BCR36DRAFT_407620 [Piromyces finnis]|uniref:Uncharacterized protein n=1 Tax=Piromyces finnis TaxID=1754191 RepID=A0A1Y1UQR0_9FUNG|nr:hypothetical protein BCR36DRAFT_407620 [Piromyces finnis]|eukprot:ORX39485.1 hypothetical protein BCR36DRAFT_407620 [Piromyces finnis]